MNSAIYQMIRTAMEGRQQVHCVYKGLDRAMCPHTLGYKNGMEKVLGFQFAGHSSKGLPPGGEWRCMFVDEIEQASAHDGPWHTRDDHLRPQTCVDEIEYEVYA